MAVWGPLMVGGSYYVITGEWSNHVAVASLAYALGPTAVLFGKHIDKLDADAQKKIHTLPVILGEARSRYTVLGMLIGQYAVIVYLVAVGYFTPALLISFAAAPSLRRVFATYRNPRPSEAPPDLPAGVWPLWFVAVTFWYNRRFGMFFLVGEGDWPIAVVSSILTGTASACASTLGQALKADIVDVDEYRTGERKEGAYFSAWTFVSKLAGGIMVWVVGTSLAVVGFDESLREQAASVRSAMVWLMAGVPVVGFAVGAAIFTRFTLSEQEHARIRAALDANSSPASTDA